MQRSESQRSEIKATEITTQRSENQQQQQRISSSSRDHSTESSNFVAGAEIKFLVAACTEIKINDYETKYSWRISKQEIKSLRPQIRDLKSINQR